MTYTTLWVRPGAQDYHYAGPYGTGDGSSYANAIAGLMNVPWATPKLQVIVADQHIKNWTTGTVAGHAKIPIVSGTIDYPIIVRGDASRFDASAKDALICSGMIDKLSPAWEDLGGGVWKRTSTKFSFSTVVWSGWISGTETKLEEITRIHPVATLAECTATENTSFLVGVGGNPWTLYIHIPVGVNPFTNWLMPAYGYVFDMTGKHHIILNYLEMWRFSLTAFTHSEVRRCKLFNNSFGLTGDKPGNTFDRCQISWGGAGIYLYSVPEPPWQVSNNFRATGCYITDMSGEWFNMAPSDGHGLAARHGIDNFYIDGCKTERTGHPIVMYNYSGARKCKKVVVKRTVCRSPHAWYVSPNWNGIALNPASSFNSVEWDGFDATGNVVERCYVEASNMNDPIRNGITVDYSVSDPNAVYRCINNQVDGGKYGISLSNGVATHPTERCSTGYLRGNVLRFQTTAHMLQAGGTTVRKDYSRNGGTDSDFNVFVDGPVPPVCDVVHGASELTLANWQSQSIRFDNNSTKI